MCWAVILPGFLCLTWASTVELHRKTRRLRMDAEKRVTSTPPVRESIGTRRTQMETSVICTSSKDQQPPSKESITGPSIEPPRAQVGLCRWLRGDSFIHSFILAISIAPLQVLYYSEALPTTARILYRS